VDEPRADHPGHVPWPPCTAGHGGGSLGHPRVHLRQTGSTNERARALAAGGAPHGTLVSAAEQTAGRGRQGRSWVAPAGSALLCSLVVRDPPPILSLIAGVAVCDVVPPDARLKWPNDVVTGPRLAKLAGILVEGRPQEGWAVLGIGLNVAVPIKQLPPELHGRAASLELPTSAIEPLAVELMRALELRLAQPTASAIEAWRERDALIGRQVSWDGGRGVAEGIDGAGRLRVVLAGGAIATLDAGEVHLGLDL
jgi:BirA family biotin operon repressor/biotin-[acetyl-CoA-carboxylase] ligase